ncbi:hypothetical protein SLEP1_g57443 [Rubroshorea leprosula]|nr:hypothetical protein SLEP1_g57443 [Rubroshorea leprosula]
MCFCSSRPPLQPNKRSPAPTPFFLRKPVRGLVFAFLFLFENQIGALKPSPLAEKISRSTLLCLHCWLLCGWVISGHFFGRELLLQIPAGNFPNCSSGFSWRILVLECSVTRALVLNLRFMRVR